MAAGAAGFPFHLWIAALASGLIAVLFFLPALDEWGFHVTRAAWCQAGTYAMVAYLFVCSFAHHAALQRVKAFASANNISIDRIGALPLPPSFLDWGGVIRSIDGVYQARFDLRSPVAPEFHFIADSPPDGFVARALLLPEVQLFLQFSRFPVIRTSMEGEYHVCGFGEKRSGTTR